MSEQVIRLPDGSVITFDSADIESVTVGNEVRNAGQENGWIGATFDNELAFLRVGFKFGSAPKWKVGE